MLRSLGAAALLAAGLLVASATASGGGPAPAAGPLPEPDFSRVDHAKPDACLAIDPHVAKAERAKALAAPLRRETPEETLAAIRRWVDRTLVYDEHAAYAWRDLDRILGDGTYGGCADHAEVVGTLARAAGIPTIWVKTMDLAWIDDFRSSRPFRSWSGHVFLEVHVRGAWRLLDAQGGVLYDAYDPAARWLPGDRFAYDKGGLPYDLLLSTRWEEWKAQTTAYFRALDAKALPWSRAAGLFDAYVAGDAPRYQWAEKTLLRARYAPRESFNQDFDRVLALARTKTLVVTCTDGVPVLPEALREAWLPPGWKAAVAAGPKAKPAVLARRLADGTRVLFVVPETREDFERALLEALAD